MDERLIDNKFAELDKRLGLEDNTPNTSTNTGIKQYKSIYEEFELDKTNEASSEESTLEKELKNTKKKKGPSVRLEGKEFGELKVIKYMENGKWLCQCSCGNTKEVGTSYLIGGYVKACGHLKGGATFKDLTGQQFGELTAIRYIKDIGKWECQCSCGNTIIKRGWDLRNNKVKMCPTCRKNEVTHKLDGQTIGNIKVLKYIKNKKYQCKCLLCNNIYEMYGSNIEKGIYKCCESCANLLKMKHKLEGKQFGKLTVLEYLGDSYWKCKCTCNNERRVHTNQLIYNKVQACEDCSINGNLIDLTGQTIGSWEVIEPIKDEKRGWNAKWKCRCLKCGNIKEVFGYNLRSRHSTSCGCDALIDMKDKKINEWTVLKYMGNSMWKCQCSCGTIQYINGYELRSGERKSCGCKSWEYARGTLLERYGEICPGKIGNNKRSLEQIDAIKDRESLVKFIKKTFGDKKPYLYDLSKSLGLSEAVATSCIRKYNIKNYIESYSSKGEGEVAKFIEEVLGIEALIRRDRQILNGKELDIYIPDKKLAIEFNGSYWHSHLYKDEYYHQNKTIECAKQGIQLIHIFEYEWLEPDKQKKIKDLILNKVANEENTKIYGRNTYIKESTNKEEVESFLDMYHLQGSAKSTIDLCCYAKDSDELLGVMTFGKPRFNNSYEYEIIRLCWRPDINVIGGTTKIFRYFTKYYNPTSIITYVDMSKFNGNSYLKLGFKPIQPNPITVPNYVWVDVHENLVLTRYQTQKQQLIKLGLGAEEQTEVEIMESLDFMKISNAGNMKLEWTQ